MHIGCEQLFLGRAVASRWGRDGVEVEPVAVFVTRASADEGWGGVQTSKRTRSLEPPPGGGGWWFLLGAPQGDRPLAPQLYEGALTENQKLKTKLQEAQLELADVKSRLEKVAQVRRRGPQGRGLQVHQHLLRRDGRQSWEQLLVPKRESSTS